MAQPYRIFGSELSPYSVKVRSWFRYKGIAHEWIVRSAANQEEFARHAKLPLIPLVLTPDGEALQDSTPILDRLEPGFPEPSIHPEEPVSRFLSILLEEFGDEWGNKWMFHYRWAREVDQVAAAGRIARSMMPGADEAQFEQTRDAIRERMVGRVGFVGSSETTAPLIEGSFRQAVDQLEAHLATRPYLFGDRPAFADFGLWPQLYEAWTDPTGGALIEGRAPRILAWIQRMLFPEDHGDYDSWERLESTLLPLLASQVGGLFTPWTLANAQALAGGEDEMTVDLATGTWTQKPQKYHAKSLGVLRQRYAELDDTSALDPVLEAAGCRALFA